MISIAATETGIITAGKNNEIFLNDFLLSKNKKNDILHVLYQVFKPLPEGFE
ncbi:hypothetical protein BGP_5832 [Beggiatoa sp. PS]|nr:hypothetical protein BGP_5832 [Beggiatoa sp. PS]